MRGYPEPWPSKEEVEQLLEEHGTISAVARELGRPYTTVRNIVNRLGVKYEPHANSMPRSEMRFGWEGEEHAALVLGGRVVRPRWAQDAPYDVEWCGARVNVKTAAPTAGGEPSSLGWSFNVRRGAGQCDFFFCIACSEAGLPVRYFLVPAEQAPSGMLRIPCSLRTKWLPFEWRPPASVIAR